MTPEQFELFYILKNQHLPFEERFRAAREVGKEALLGNIRLKALVSEKIPMMEWCKQNDFVVYCNRCGLDITYTVSNDCPFTKGR